ncbi:MAG TPA: hypothetical protein VNO31_46600 [Umezawaea sp.]|nr:hypothetical protein [Umezawaea sp.]
MTDDWRSKMASWTPGKPEWPTPVPNLVPDPADDPNLTPAEAAIAAESKRLIAVLGEHRDDGYSLACVADVDVAEAVRRLDAEVLTAADVPTDEDILVLAATTVPGGCVLFQPWGYGASTPGVLTALSFNTTCYGMYANPKSGDQGSVVADGVWLGSDLFPGGGPDEDDDSPQLLERFYEDHAIAYCFAYVDLKPTDARSITGPPDTWLRLPERDYYAV